MLPLPLPAAAAAGARSELRRGRRARRAAGRHRLDSGERGAEARARHRRPAHRPAAALRRARGDVHRGRRCGAIRPARSAATRRRSPSTSTTSSSARAQAWQRRRMPPTLPENAERTRTSVRSTDVARGVGGAARGARHWATPSARSSTTSRLRFDRSSTRQLQFVNVYVDGEDVRTLDELETRGRDGATVILLPAMAGGCASRLAPSLLDLVGDTPLVELTRLRTEVGRSRSTRSSRGRTRPARSRTASRRR